MKNGRVIIGNTDMDYVSFGRGKKQLVVLPGLSDGLTTVKGKAWILSLPYRKFFRDYTVFLFSRKNEMPQGYTIEDMADDQVQAMRSLGIGKACILGVSQGGMIAQSIAARHPDAADRLILAVTAPYANPTLQQTVSAWIGMAERKDHTALMTDTAEKMYSEKYLRKNRMFFPLLAKLTKPASYSRFLINAHAILQFDARDSLSKIACPTLIIAGSDDHTVGNQAAAEMNSRIRRSELFVYDGLGHGAFDEAGDFYDRALAFCNRP